MGNMTDRSRNTGSRRTVLLTGAGRPGQVGEVVARSFLDAGDRVLLVERQRDRALVLLDSLGASAGMAAAFGADLSQAGDVDALARDIAATAGSKLDAVVHLAGGWLQGSSVADSSTEYWEQSITRNLMTAVNVARAFAPAVRSARGAFVFVASEAALPGARVGGMAAYAVAKQGVVTLARALAQEERGHGVRANVIAPGSIRTAANEAAMGTDAAYVEREEVAAAILWLCSRAASAVSGEVLRLGPGGRPSRPDAAG